MAKGKISVSGGLDVKPRHECYDASRMRSTDLNPIKLETVKRRQKDVIEDLELFFNARHRKDVKSYNDGFDGLNRSLTRYLIKLEVKIKNE